MRGAPLGASMGDITCRITPACAGSTTRDPGGSDQAKDHPRLCGEHYTDFFCQIFDTGSPPPVRGALTPSLDPSFTCRITPACAGSTPLTGSTSAPTRDHPRLGSNIRWFQYPYGKQHPRLCGEHVYPSLRLFAGITPACAGSTCKRRAVVHPREGSPPPVRSTGPKFSRMLIGSPPPVRGSNQHKFALLTLDHPRLCGEHHYPNIPRCRRPCLCGSTLAFFSAA